MQAGAVYLVGLLREAAHLLSQSRVCGGKRCQLLLELLDQENAVSVPVLQPEYGVLEVCQLLLRFEDVAPEDLLDLISGAVCCLLARLLGGVCSVCGVLHCVLQHTLVERFAVAVCSAVDAHDVIDIQLLQVVALLSFRRLLAFRLESKVLCHSLQVWRAGLATTLAVSRLQGADCGAALVHGFHGFLGAEMLDGVNAALVRGLLGRARQPRALIESGQGPRVLVALVGTAGVCRRLAGVAVLRQVTAPWKVCAEIATQLFFCHFFFRAA